MESAVYFVTTEVLELGMVAGVCHFKCHYLEDDLLQLTLVEGAFTDAIHIVQVEGVMGFDVLLVVWEQVVVYLQVAQSTAPFIIYPLFVCSTHLLNFFVILNVFIAEARVLQVFHVFDGLVSLLVRFEVLQRRSIGFRRWVHRRSHRRHRGTHLRHRLDIALGD